MNKYFLKKYSHSYHLSQSGHPSKFFFLLIFTTLRFSHALPMKASLGKASKFPLPSILMPSSSSSTIKLFPKGFCLLFNSKCDFLSK